MIVQTILRLPRESRFAWRVDFSPDGKMIATGGRQEDRWIPSPEYNIGVRLWDASTLQELKTLGGFDTKDIKFSPDGRYLACIKHDQVYLWGFQSEDDIVLEGYGAEIRRIAYSPDGNRIAAACSDGTVCLWDVKTRELVVLQAHNDEMQCAMGYGAFSVTFSPDGRLLASGGSDNMICFWYTWDLGQKVFEFELPETTGIYHLAFNPNSSWLAVGTEDTIEVWDISSRQQKYILRQGGLGSHRVAFSSNGLILAGAMSFPQHRDSELWLWGIGDIISGLPGYRLILPDDKSYEVNDLAFSPDDKVLASALGTEVIFWNLSSQP